MEVDHRVLGGRIARTLRGASEGHAGISQKVLTEEPRELIGDGIVERQPKGAIPAPVEYSLTDYGRSLLPLVEDLRLWGHGH